MQSMNRKLGQCGSVLALSMLALLTAGSAAAGGRWDYWDPRASIPARIVDAHLGVIGLAATFAGDYRTAAVVDHLSGRFPAVAPIPVPVPVVQHVYYPPPPVVVEHVYYPPPAPIVVQHVHAFGCGHRGYAGGYGYGRGYRGYGGRHGHHRGYGRHGGWDD
ncbi:MAG: hypothetical protein K2X91_13595 [Thermoleophilia bacterium]|nr:hypothetical protein [Thermoleophilia bacterium]